MINNNWATPSKSSLQWKQIKLESVKNLKEYCEVTTINGLKYIADGSLFALERIFFALSFICMVLATTFYVYKNYEKWLETPVIISLSPKPTWITQDPFPAVTICNMNQAYKQKAEKYSIYSVEYAMIQMICQREANVTIASSIKDWNNLPKFITEISQPCSEMLVNCQIGGIQYKCNEIFQPIVTNGGLCCTFNMVHTKHIVKERSIYIKSKLPNGIKHVSWSAETGYADNLPDKFVPMPAAGTGESLGLSLTLDVEADEYYCSSTNSVGFKILLKNPLDLPNISDNGVVIAPGYETSIRVEAFKKTTEKSLRSLNKNSRHCLFEDELDLKRFKFYTQHYCELDCLSEMILKSCGCIPYYMNMIFPNKTICSIYVASCVERVRLNFMIINQMEEQTGSCRCMPGCFHLYYKPIFFRARLAPTGFMSTGVKNMSNAYTAKNIARVHVFFKDHWYRSTMQSEYIGITDFLSNVGGIIGLFLGFSFISLAEIIYFMILKPAHILMPTKWLKYGKTTETQHGGSLQIFTLPDKITNLSGIQYQFNDWKRKQNSFLASNKNVAQKRNVSWRPNLE